MLTVINATFRPFSLDPRSVREGSRVWSEQNISRKKCEKFRSHFAKKSVKTFFAKTIGVEAVFCLFRWIVVKKLQLNFAFFAKQIKANSSERNAKWSRNDFSFSLQTLEGRETMQSDGYYMCLLILKWYAELCGKHTFLRINILRSSSWICFVLSTVYTWECLNRTL